MLVLVFITWLGILGREGRETKPLGFSDMLMLKVVSKPPTGAAIAEMSF